MDTIYMERALELAKKGIGKTNPNPLVGAVIVKDGVIIGEGYHQEYGGPHAEINAINNASMDVQGATMYVTLEPCSHYGKTPPCAQALVDHQIKRLVIAMKDPNPKVAGKGIAILEAAGIQVDVGLLKEEAEHINEIFIKFITRQEPFVLLKTAMTFDGKIATRSGASQWISNERSRQYVHQLRNQYSAIMVGINTVLTDNPSLTTRLDSGDNHHPTRVIVDTYGRLPMESKLVQTANIVPTILATTKFAKQDTMNQLKEKGVQILMCEVEENHVDLKDLMKKLGGKEIDSIMVEGGATINYSLLEQKLVDKVITFVAPKIFGGREAPTPVGGIGIANPENAIQLTNIRIVPFEEDIMIEGYVKGE
jgi:diaminohydroxyphosphoribosylaminopyrimidine deaminase/5-amino-6-(5-phosphoribosylamino)uracil reductase